MVDLPNVSAVFAKGFSHGAYVGATGDTTRLKRMKAALLEEIDSESSEKTDSNEV